MILELRKITKDFKSGDSNLRILNELDLSLEQGESVALLGPSGSGKSTLLQISALLEKPSSGDIILHGQNISKLSDEEKTKLRRKNVGFVYQFHNLLGEFSALENVMIPQIINGVFPKEAKKTAALLLDQIGLSNRLNHYPKTLSGGEQQRVAIARALANNPELIIADEPTGNLDPYTSKIVFDIFLKLVKEKNMSLFMATHNIELAAKLKRNVSIINGKLENNSIEVNSIELS